MEPAFKDLSYFVNLDSICESGSDEYISKDDLFELEQQAIKHGLSILKEEKIKLMTKYNEADYLYSSLLDKYFNCKDRNNI